SLTNSALNSSSIQITTDSGDINVGTVGVGGNSTATLTLDAAGNISGTGNIKGTTVDLSAGLDIGTSTVTVNTVTNGLTLSGADAYVSNASSSILQLSAGASNVPGTLQLTNSKGIALTGSALTSTSINLTTNSGGINVGTVGIGGSSTTGLSL